MKNKEILVPTSLGELLDKISILKIKKKKIVDKTKKKNVIFELQYLSKIYKANFSNNKKLKIYESKLLKINNILWDIEDKIRFLEAKKEFKKEFITLARSVYINNDKRADLKKKINILVGSDIVEEKSYKSY